MLTIHSPSSGELKSLSGSCSFSTMTEIEFGLPLPSDLEYAVSFSIPTWKSAMGYVEREPDVLKRMVTGYPRHFPQPPIKELCSFFMNKYGKDSESCRPFPSLQVAQDCLEYLTSTVGFESGARIEVENIEIHSSRISTPQRTNIRIYAVIVSNEYIETVKEYWKLRGECVSSRLATLVNQWLNSRGGSLDSHEFRYKILKTVHDGKEAKEIIKRRIGDNHVTPFHRLAGSTDPIGISLDWKKDVHLVSSGMSSIFTVRKFLEVWERNRASNSLNQKQEGLTTKTCNTTAIVGFPFKATQVVMEKFGQRLFFGHGDSRDIEELESFLENNGRILGVFVEAPSNPLLNVPAFKRLRRLADKHNFAVTIDDTIGGLNANVLPYADFVCTSLTKFFNGSGNLMGGSIILNPKSLFYSSAAEFFNGGTFEDLFWCEDALVLERNSRNFEERTLRSNTNTEKLLKEVLLPEEGKAFKKIYYPSLSSNETFINYEAIRTNIGGYGNLFSLVFHDEPSAAVFYDSLKIFKGPSNGTNFTLACPYVHLAHHTELEKVSDFEVDSNLVRVSVGLEDDMWLLDVFSDAIQALKSKKA